MSRIKDHYADQLNAQRDRDPGPEAYSFLFAPPTPLGLRSAWAEREGVQLLCYYEFSPEQRGAREPTTGVQLEPDEPASATMMHVYVRDVDILPLLHWKMIDDLEREVIA